MNKMQRYLNESRIAIACFCLLAYIFAAHAQSDRLSVNLTRCTDVIIQLSASDMTVNGTVLLSYESDIEVSFHPTCKSDYFMINSSASELVLNSDLRKYCNPTLECRIQCKQRTWYIISLLIYIIRNASYTMEFNKAGYNASIRELTSETEILPSFRNQLNIKECNEGSLISSPSFFIVQSTKPDWFTTKQSTTSGIIYSTSLVDYERLNDTTEVIMTICGEQLLDTSYAKLIAYTIITVTIIDVDDMNPVFTQDVFHLNITEGKSGLSDNPYKTTPPIHAYDGDQGINETIIYSIEDNMKSFFTINNVSGEISVLQELDADEGRDLYVMIIKATQKDNPLRTATSTLSLSVIDIDDNPPIFSPDHYNCSINEHSAVGQIICTVTATDKDKGVNANFTYHFRNTSTVVEIDQITGVIKVKDSQMLDREKEAIINVQVVTKYNNGSDGPNTANVTINLIDINDNNPEFKSSSYEFRVWNKRIGDYIGKIDAFDLDEGDKKRFNYSIGICLSNTGFCSEDSSNCRFPFQIDRQFGTITLNESSASCIYSALVSVCDSPHYSTRCSTTRLIIHAECNMTNTETQTSAVPEYAASNSLVDQISAKGYTSTSVHCSPVYPESTETGNISRPVVRSEIQQLAPDGNQLVFFCDFDPLSDPSTLYQVTWYRDKLETGSKLMASTFILYNSREKFRSLTYLTEAYITLGMTILCTISTTKLTVAVPSEPYFAGFEMTSNNSIKLHYTEQTVVYIQLTVPFGCRRQREECFLGVNMFYMEKGADNCLFPVPAALSGCGVRISSWRWNQSYAFRLALKHGQNLYSISRTYNIRFKTDEHFDHNLFRNYTLPRDIQIEATSYASSLNGRECHSICDPHMQTFDGRYYENQNKGTYILYKHLKIPVQVQMKTSPCYGFQEGPPFCPCGVAIAAGRDVFVVDRCSIPIKIYMPQCDEGILQGKIKSDGNFYQIYLPSGSWVKITSGISFNIYIYPSLSDRMATSGLCGYLDSDVQNDFMLRNGTSLPDQKFEDFNSHWLVKPEEDLFNASNYLSLPRWPREDYFCICEQYQHGRIFQSDNCSPDSRKFCPESALNDSLAADCSRKLSTNVSVSIQLDASDFNFSQSRNDTTMMKRNFTEDSASYECWFYLNSSLLFKKCSEVPDIVPESFANTCTMDALIAKTMFWAPTHLDNAQKKCIYQVTVNQPLSDQIIRENNVTLNPDEQSSNKTTNETDVYTSALLQELADMACPMNCTDQGDCIKGKCICYRGYGGNDCSVDLGKAPDVYGIPNRGVCDLHKTSCDHISILGDTFADSPNLSCRLSLFQVKRDERRFHDDSSIMLKAKWISFAEVSCPIVDVRSKRSVEFPDDLDTLAIGYSVAVGNNRDIFGRNISLLIVDSLCLDCIKAGFDIACTLKDGFDLINRRCIKKKFAEKETESGSTALIISIVVGSVLTVVVVGVILYYCLMVRRRRDKYEKKARETAYGDLQKTEGQKENYSNIEEVYDEIRDLPDHYLTIQDTIPTVDESKDREGSYEKLSNAEKISSKGYSYLNTLTTIECESKAGKHENIELRTSTGETSMHYQKPNDDHANTDENVQL